MRYMRLVSIVFIGTIPLLVIMALFLALIPSQFFIVPRGVQITLTDTERSILAAYQLPYGAVAADREVGIVVLKENADVTCPYGESVSYKPTDEPIEVIPISPWGDKCIDVGPPLSITITYTVRLLWGWVRLRPTQIVYTMQAYDSPPVRTRGLAPLMQPVE